MCNSFGDPVCASHEGAVREALGSAERSLVAAVEAHRAQTGNDTRATVGAARAAFYAAQARWDQTLTGLDLLRRTLDDPHTTGKHRTALVARHELAVRRRADAENRWRQSRQWAEQQLATTDPDTARFERYLLLVAARRAAENGTCWPQPDSPRGIAAWGDSAAGATYSALAAAGVTYPQITFAFAAVIDAGRRTPEHPGWSPLVAAHYAHLPKSLRPRTFHVTQHLAANRGVAVVATMAQIVAYARSEGSIFVDDHAAIPVHDAIAGQRWLLMPVVGPVDVTTGARRAPQECRCGVFAVREHDSRFVVLVSPPEQVARSVGLTAP